jgi:hypothetical protein
MAGHFSSCAALRRGYRVGQGGGQMANGPAMRLNGPYLMAHVAPLSARQTAKMHKGEGAA